MIKLNDHVKEEPVDAEIEEPMKLAGDQDNDVIIASYDIALLDFNNKIKTFSLAGLRNVMINNNNNNRRPLNNNNMPSCDISIRTDSKELKIVSKQRDHNQHNRFYHNQQQNNTPPLAVFTTKESQLNLRRKSFAVKLSRETGKAYFMPINSMHTLSHLDENNRDSNPIDTQNVIFEDCFKSPHPSRTKHDFLHIEMKSHLYKPLARMNESEKVKKFFEQLFSSMTIKKSSNVISGSNNRISNVNSSNKNRPTNNVMELINCPYWFLNKINICDMNRIDLIELRTEILMRKVQVIRFSEIILLYHWNDTLELEQNISKLLNTLQSICYLIDGNWVIKSHLLYKYDTIHDSDYSQTIMKQMIAAREYLLYHFINNKLLLMSNIVEIFKKVNDHEEILNRLTLRNGSKNEIKFILEPDTNFISTYPLVSKKHHERTRELLASKFKEHLDILNHS